MKKRYIVLGIFIIIGLIVCYIIMDYYNLLPTKYYYGEHFNIEVIKSKIDYNDNGIDDYTDIMLGAREYINTNPKYKSEYYDGGYPPEAIGVCTDVIWSAFMNAGYNLKDMIDEDIKNNVDDYPRVDGKPDSNIDFRRVLNLNVFFKKYALVLTNDIDKIEEWQPGDIVVFTKHIGVISDKRNKNGIPYIIHHAGQPRKEEDAIGRYKIVGHYRWNGLA